MKPFNHEMLKACSIIRLATILPAIFLLLPGNSYNIMVYTAHLGAWVVTL